MVDFAVDGLVINERKLSAYRRKDSPNESSVSSLEGPLKVKFSGLRVQTQTLAWYHRVILGC